jgi:hypothetical protein
LVKSEIRGSDLSFWVLKQYGEERVSGVSEIHNVFTKKGEVSLNKALNL